MKKWLIFFVVAGFFWSCQTRVYTHSFEVLKPSLYTMPEEVTRILVLDHTRPYRGETPVTIRNLDQVYKIDSLHHDELANIMVLSLWTKLNSRNFFAAVEVDTSSSKTILEAPEAQLTATEVERICNAWNVDALVVMDQLKYNTMIELTKPEPSFYFTQMNSNVQSLWRFYQSNPSRVGTFESKSDTLFWSGSGYDPAETVSGFPTYRSSWEEVAQWSVGQMADWIAPQWVPQYREFFVWGNDYFEKGGSFVLQGKWDEAERNWGFIYVNGSIIEKARAARNIALSLEIKGMIDDAVLWIERSREQYANITKKRYANEKQKVNLLSQQLTERIKEVAKLKKQMGE